MELAKPSAELLTELLAELKARVEIQQLKELEVFDSLRLSIVFTVEILAEVLVKLAAKLVTEIV